jgi:nucleoid-associated protein YgaU
MTALVMTQVRPVRVPVTSPSVGAARRPAGGDGPLRLTVRGRVVLVLLALLTAGVGLFTWQAGQASADGASGAVEVVRHVVQPGETLWGIAREVTGPGEDVRDVVMELVELNGLPSAGLMAGQSIVVPAA